jgi:hypothetical protein
MTDDPGLPEYVRAQRDGVSNASETIRCALKAVRSRLGM